MRRPLTIGVLLQRVGDQTAVIRARRQQIRDAIVVVVIIALVAFSIFISVQLGTIYHSWAVVPRVLVTITIT